MTDVISLTNPDDENAPRAEVTDEVLRPTSVAAVTRPPSAVTAAAVAAADAEPEAVRAGNVDTTIASGVSMTVVVVANAPNVEESAAVARPVTAADVTKAPRAEVAAAEF